MTIRELAESGIATMVLEGSDPDQEIRDVFCCDLLSIAMSRGIADAAWVTVMGNINTLAVLRLTDMACLVLAEGVQMDEAGMEKARQEGISILQTDQSIFATALQIHEAL